MVAQLSACHSTTVFPGNRRVVHSPHFQSRKVTFDNNTVVCFAQTYVLMWKKTVLTTQATEIHTSMLFFAALMTLFAHGHDDQRGYLCCNIICTHCRFPDKLFQSRALCQLQSCGSIFLLAMRLPGLPHLWTEKSDGGLGASPPMGVKEAAPRRMSSFLN